MKKKKKFNSYSPVITLPAILVYTSFLIMPLIISFIFSFSDWNVVSWETPEFNGLTNYKEILADPIFTRSLLNTFVNAFGTAILKIVLGILLALPLSKAFKGNGIFRTIFYVPCVISATVVGVLFTSILAKEGLLNNVLGFLHLNGLQHEWLGHYGSAMLWIILVDVWMWAGFNMFIFISGIQAIPKDYYEVADLEGASKVKQFFTITLPLLMPAITVNTTLNISGGMKVFDVVYVLTNGGPGTDTQVLSTYAYRAFSLGYLGESSAASIILCILVVIITFGLNKVSRNLEVEV